MVQKVKGLSRSVAGSLLLVLEQAEGGKLCCGRGVQLNRYAPKKKIRPLDSSLTHE